MSCILTQPKSGPIEQEIVVVVKSDVLSVSWENSKLLDYRNDEYTAWKPVNKGPYPVGNGTYSLGLLTSGLYVVGQRYRAVVTCADGTVVYSEPALVGEANLVSFLWSDCADEAVAKFSGTPFPDFEWRTKGGQLIKEKKAQEPNNVSILTREEAKPYESQELYGIAKNESESVKTPTFQFSYVRVSISNNGTYDQLVATVESSNLSAVVYQWYAENKDTGSAAPIAGQTTAILKRSDVVGSYALQDYEFFVSVRLTTCGQSDKSGNGKFHYLLDNSSAFDSCSDFFTVRYESFPTASVIWASYNTTTGSYEPVDPSMVAGSTLYRPSGALRDTYFDRSFAYQIDNLYSTSINKDFGPFADLKAVRVEPCATNEIKLSIQSAPSLPGSYAVQWYQGDATSQDTLVPAESGDNLAISGNRVGQYFKAVVSHVSCASKSITLSGLLAPWLSSSAPVQNCASGVFGYQVNISGAGLLEGSITTTWVNVDDASDTSTAASLTSFGREGNTYRVSTTAKCAADSTKTFSTAWQTVSFPKVVLEPVSDCGKVNCKVLNTENKTIKVTAQSGTGQEIELEKLVVIVEGAVREYYIVDRPNQSDALSTRIRCYVMVNGSWCNAHELFHTWSQLAISGVETVCDNGQFGYRVNVDNSSSLFNSFSYQWRRVGQSEIIATSQILTVSVVKTLAGGYKDKSFECVVTANCSGSTVSVVSNSVTFPYLTLTEKCGSVDVILQSPPADLTKLLYSINGFQRTYESTINVTIPAIYVGPEPISAIKLFYGACLLDSVDYKWTMVAAAVPFCDNGDFGYSANIISGPANPGAVFTYQWKDSTGTLVSTSQILSVTNNQLVKGESYTCTVNVFCGATTENPIYTLTTSAVKFPYLTVKTDPGNCNRKTFTMKDGSNDYYLTRTVNGVVEVLNTEIIIINGDRIATVDKITGETSVTVDLMTTVNGTACKVKSLTVPWEDATVISVNFTGLDSAPYLKDASGNYFLWTDDRIGMKQNGTTVTLSATSSGTTRPIQWEGTNDGLTWVDTGVTGSTYSEAWTGYNRIRPFIDIECAKVTGAVVNLITIEFDFFIYQSCITDANGTETKYVYDKPKVVGSTLNTQYQAVSTYYYDGDLKGETYRYYWNNGFFTPNTIDNSYYLTGNKLPLSLVISLLESQSISGFVNLAKIKDTASSLGVLYGSYEKPLTNFWFTIENSGIYYASGTLYLYVDLKNTYGSFVEGTNAKITTTKNGISTSYDDTLSNDQQIRLMAPAPSYSTNESTNYKFDFTVAVGSKDPDNQNSCLLQKTGSYDFDIENASSFYDLQGVIGIENFSIIDGILAFDTGYKILINDIPTFPSTDNADFPLKNGESEFDILNSSGVSVLSGFPYFEPEINLSKLDLTVGEEYTLFWGYIPENAGEYRYETYAKFVYDNTVYFSESFVESKGLWTVKNSKPFIAHNWIYAEYSTQNDIVYPGRWEIDIRDPYVLDGNVQVPGPAIDCLIEIDNASLNEVQRSVPKNQDVALVVYFYLRTKFLELQQTQEVGAFLHIVVTDSVDNSQQHKYVSLFESSDGVLNRIMLHINLSSSENISHMEFVAKKYTDVQQLLSVSATSTQPSNIAATKDFKTQINLGVLPDLYGSLPYSDASQYFARVFGYGFVPLEGRSDGF